MTLELADPPASLTGPPRAFYDELREMVAAVAPAQVDAAKTSVRFDKDGLELGLVHTEREEWVIWAAADSRDLIVGTEWAHEHFTPRDETDDRAWTTQAVDFIAELLRGEIEIETTFRGDTPVSVSHYNRDDTGERALLGHTGFLVPGRLLVWKPKRTETARVSFL